MSPFQISHVLLIPENSVKCGEFYSRLFVPEIHYEFLSYDEKRQLSRFVESYVARSNAKQRRGRAGRVQEGLAFHLFTKARHDTQASPLLKLLSRVSGLFLIAS